MSDLEKRRKRAVEHILENEALTSDLDDAAALKLNAWGIRLAASLADETSDMQHDKGLEHIGERIRSLRRLVRNINRLSGRVNRLDENALRERFQLILKHARELFGKRFPELSDEEKERILQHILKRRDNPVDLVEALTAFIDDAVGAEDDVIDHMSPIVQAAEKSVRFMAYSFTHDILGDAVIDRFEQGKDVMGIFELRGSETEYSELGRMNDLGMQVRQDGNSRTFHFKNFVLDENTVMTGSFNYSESADESNDENVLLLKNEDISQLYLDEFDRRWEEGSDYEPDEDS